MQLFKTYCVSGDFPLVTIFSAPHSRSFLASTSYYQEGIWRTSIFPTNQRETEVKKAEDIDFDQVTFLLGLFTNVWAHPPTIEEHERVVESYLANLAMCDLMCD